MYLLATLSKNHKNWNTFAPCILIVSPTLNVQIQIYFSLLLWHERLDFQSGVFESTSYCWSLKFLIHTVKFLICCNYLLPVNWLLVSSYFISIWRSNCLTLGGFRKATIINDLVYIGVISKSKIVQNYDLDHAENFQKFPLRL